MNGPAARYTVDIDKLPAKGVGVFEAAAKSPSLTICDDVAGSYARAACDPRGMSFH